MRVLSESNLHNKCECKMVVCHHKILGLVLGSFRFLWNDFANFPRIEATLSRRKAESSSSFSAREEVSYLSPDLRLQHVKFPVLNDGTDYGIYVEFFMCHTANPSVYMCC